MTPSTSSALAALILPAAIRSRRLLACFAITTALHLATADHTLTKER